MLNTEHFPKSPFTAIRNDHLSNCIKSNSLLNFKQGAGLWYDALATEPLTITHYLWVFVLPLISIHPGEH